jgi:hypothetical protein
MMGASFSNFFEKKGLMMGWIFWWCRVGFPGRGKLQVGKCLPGKGILPGSKNSSREE